MNGYQRSLISFYPLSEFSTCTDCYGEQVADLSEDLLQAAGNGSLEIIQEYLDNGGDVNAELEEESLLSRACSSGQTELVSLLLRQPKVHLNKLFGNRTPISRAAQKGHVQCIRLILEAKGRCRLTSLKLAWRGVTKALRERPILTADLAQDILLSGAFERQWEVVRLLLQTSYHFPEKSLHLVVLHSIDSGEWDVVEQVLQKKFAGREKLLNVALAIAVRLEIWDKVQELLQKKDRKLDRRLIIAALEEDVKGFKKLLDQESHDLKTLNGCLVVIAAAGASEAVAQCLLRIRNTYSQETFSDALFVACDSQHSVIFSHLLCHPEASYSFHDLILAHKVLKSHYEYRYSDQSLIVFLEKFMKLNTEKMITGSLS